MPRTVFHIFPGSNNNKNKNFGVSGRIMKQNFKYFSCMWKQEIKKIKREKQRGEKGFSENSCINRLLF